MTDAGYLAQHTRAEATVNRSSFLCDDRCRELVGHSTWTHHAWALLQFLADTIDASWYDEPQPEPATDIPHLDADLIRYRDHFEASEERCQKT
jgi:hypothetical protein